MKTPFLLLSCGILSIAASSLHADQLEMQNGDRYNGKVLSVSTETVVLQNEVLGKINVPRNKVATLTFGTNAVAAKVSSNVAPVSVPTNLPNTAALAALANGKTNLAANEDVVRQIREQMLAGSPEAASKYDELASGLLSGKLNVNDVRREAQASAEQLRKLKTELGPEAGDSLNAYLEILDSFLKESAAAPATTPAPQPKASTR
jgi:ABC-type amino acid transport substrate-binding protein